MAKPILDTNIPPYLEDAECQRSRQDHPPEVENPRTTRVRKIVLDAATVLLIEKGHHAVTPHRVSKVTGIARSTIYRHWPYPGSLLMDAIGSALAPDYT